MSMGYICRSPLVGPDPMEASIEEEQAAKTIPSFTSCAAR